MLGRKKTFETHSCIAAGMHVQGDCVFAGVLQIDGTVHGNVVASEGEPSTLILSENARVEGELRADTITIDGSVVGPVTARGALALHAHAQIQGNVRYLSLEMQPGALISGQLQPQLPPMPADQQEPTVATDPVQEEVASPPPPTHDKLEEPTLDLNRSLDLR